MGKKQEKGNVNKRRDNKGNNKKEKIIREVTPCIERFLEHLKSVLAFIIVFTHLKVHR